MTRPHYELTLHGPAKNALGTQMLTFLQDGITEAAGRPILLSGAGGALSSGLNLKEVASLDAPGMERFIRLLEDTLVALYTHPAPVVARVDGHAVAGGCVLALCADHSVAVSDPGARVGLNEVALGLRFPPRILGIVRDRVPPHRHGEVLLGAGLYDPAGALRVGLVDEVCADAAATAKRALEKLQALSAHPPKAYADTKRDLRARNVTIDAAAEARAYRELVPVWTADEVRARILAVLRR
jgi:enoyl-CoA hydratase/carnithine racemase